MCKHSMDASGTRVPLCHQKSNTLINLVANTLCLFYNFRISNPNAILFGLSVTCWHHDKGCSHHPISLLWWRWGFITLFSTLQVKNWLWDYPNSICHFWELTLPPLDFYTPYAHDLKKEYKKLYSICEYSSKRLTWCFRLVSGRNSIHEHPFIVGPKTRYSVTASRDGSKLECWAKTTLSVFPSSRSTYNQ
jgi:hypothetical protein